MNWETQDGLWNNPSPIFLYTASLYVNWDVERLSMYYHLVCCAGLLLSSLELSLNLVLGCCITREKLLLPLSVATDLLWRLLREQPGSWVYGLYWVHLHMPLFEGRVLSTEYGWSSSLRFENVRDGPWRSTWGHGPTSFFSSENCFSARSEVMVLHA